MAGIHRTVRGGAQTSGGDRVPNPPRKFGGGGGRGDGGRAHPNGRLRGYRMGLYLGAGCVAIFFVLFTTFFVAWKMAATPKFWMYIPLPNRLLLANTALLAVSALCAELGRRAAAREAVLVPLSTIPGIVPERRTARWWLRLSSLLGLGFLAGQYLAWHRVQAGGALLTTSPSASFFYLFTAIHAVHLAGGVLALLYAGLAPRPGRRLDSLHVSADIAALSWHFMALLWIYVFVLLKVLA